MPGGYDDGSGIRMAIGVGAAAINMEQFICTMPYFPPGSLVKAIFVNAYDQHFINEDAYYEPVTHYILRQPSAWAWLLLANAIFDRLNSNPRGKDFSCGREPGRSGT